jgi:hypothetical protein
MVLDCVERGEDSLVDEAMVVVYRVSCLQTTIDPYVFFYLLQVEAWLLRWGRALEESDGANNFGEFMGTLYGQSCIWRTIKGNANQFQ